MSLCIHENLESHCMSCNAPALVLFCAIHKRHKDKGQRLGQLFVNMFIKHDQADERLRTLYHEENEGKAREIIRNWLAEHCYVYQLPPVRNEMFKDWI